MRVPPYWAKGTITGSDQKGKEHTFWAWGWSFASLAEARDDAVARAKRIFDRLTTGQRPDSYAYLEHPLREEIIDSVSIDDREIAIVTRNRYGALVLNSALVLFADVDFPKPKRSGFLNGILLSFSKARREKRVEAAREGTLQAVAEWVRSNPRRSFRLYRTRAGLRLLFTDQLYGPNTTETSAILKSLGCDPLYRRLTEKQECFRARLTPKPWRCGCPVPPNRYPWPDQKAEKAYREWERKYTEKTQGYKTCELLEVIGAGPQTSEVETIVQFHDRFSCDATTVALA